MVGRRVQVRRLLSAKQCHAVVVVIRLLVLVQVDLLVGGAVAAGVAERDARPARALESFAGARGGALGAVFATLLATVFAFSVVSLQSFLVYRKRSLTFPFEYNRHNILLHTWMAGIRESKLLAVRLA